VTRSHDFHLTERDGLRAAGGRILERLTELLQR
jgi:hypothetical protein